MAKKKTATVKLNKDGSVRQKPGPKAGHKTNGKPDPIEDLAQQVVQSAGLRGYVRGVRAMHEAIAVVLAKGARRRGGVATGHVFDNVAAVAAKLIESVDELSNAPPN